MFLFWYLFCSTNSLPSSLQPFLEHKYCYWDILHWQSSWQFYSNWCTQNIICCLLEWSFYPDAWSRAFVACLWVELEMFSRPDFLLIGYFPFSLLLWTLFVSFIINKKSSHFPLLLISSSQSCTSSWHCGGFYSSITIKTRTVWNTFMMFSFYNVFCCGSPVCNKW